MNTWMNTAKERVEEQFSGEHAEGHILVVLLSTIGFLVYCLFNLSIWWYVPCLAIICISILTDLDYLLGSFVLAALYQVLIDIMVSLISSFLIWTADFEAVLAFEYLDQIPFLIAFFTFFVLTWAKVLKFFLSGFSMLITLKVALYATILPAIAWIHDFAFLDQVRDFVESVPNEAVVVLLAVLHAVATVLMRFAWFERNVGRVVRFFDKIFSWVPQ